MREYMKPVAELELFCLDSEFAGACLAADNSVPPDGFEASIVEGMSVTIMSQINYYNNNKDIVSPFTLTQTWDLLNAYNTDHDPDMTFDIFITKGEDFIKSECEHYVLHNNFSMNTDNATSGTCYFTWNNPRNKTFS